MFKKFALVAVLAAFPIAASAQTDSGVAAGATSGAIGGAIVGGPIGAVVGGVGGAIIGGVMTDNTPRFREYVVQQRRPSYSYAQPLAVGVQLPSDGVQYYEVPAEYGATEYRYTVVNNRTVLVDPRTRRVIQVIE
ncbi:MAG: hypothetical protein JWN93_795 [Hyphomicrobiales bacterium]|nr:hypothetical protein [Hyphomicrobiales bacterium]